MSHIKVNAGCVRVKSKKASCQRCIDSCHKDAIALTNTENIDINLVSCDGCGNCVVACPVMAIDGPLPNRTVDGDTLYAIGASIPSVKELLLYCLSGVKEIVIEDRLSPWLEHVEQANHVLAEVGFSAFTVSEDSVAIGKRLTQEPVSKGRRAFLKFDLLPHRSGLAPIRNRLLNQIVDGYQLFHISLDAERCTLCSACLRLCPTASIKYENRRFVIDHARCVGCLLCQDSCPEKALCVDDDIQRGTTSRYPFVSHVCVDCKQNYLSLSELGCLCIACRIKKAFRA